MRNLSNNPYIKAFSSKSQGYLPNDYLFGEYVPVKPTDSERAHASIFELLTMLRFDIRLTGTNFLSRLVMMYLYDDDYEIGAATKSVADSYGVGEAYLHNCVSDCINENRGFVSAASELFNFGIMFDAPPSINETVLIVGALAKIYFNQDVPDFSSRADGLAVYRNRIFS